MLPKQQIRCGAAWHQLVTRDGVIRICSLARAEAPDLDIDAKLALNS